MASDKSNKENKEDKKVGETPTTSSSKNVSNKSKKPSKFVGNVLKTFRKKNKEYQRGTSYDAIDKNSFDYLVKSGFIEPIK